MGTRRPWTWNVCSRKTVYCVSRHQTAPGHARTRRSAGGGPEPIHNGRESRAAVVAGLPQWRKLEWNRKPWKRQVFDRKSRPVWTDFDGRQRSRPLIATLFRLGDDRASILWFRLWFHGVYNVTYLSVGKTNITKLHNITQASWLKFSLNFKSSRENKFFRNKNLRKIQIVK